MNPREVAHLRGVRRRAHDALERIEALLDLAERDLDEHLPLAAGGAGDHPQVVGRLATVLDRAQQSAAALRKGD